MFHAFAGFYVFSNNVVDIPTFTGTTPLVWSFGYSMAIIDKQLVTDGTKDNFVNGIELFEHCPDGYVILKHNQCIKSLDYVFVGKPTYVKKNKTANVKVATKKDNIISEKHGYSLEAHSFNEDGIKELYNRGLISAIQCHFCQLATYCGTLFLALERDLNVEEAAFLDRYPITINGTIRYARIWSGEPKHWFKLENFNGIEPQSLCFFENNFYSDQITVINPDISDYKFNKGVTLCKDRNPRIMFPVSFAKHLEKKFFDLSEDNTFFSLIQNEVKFNKSFIEGSDLYTDEIVIHHNDGYRIYNRHGDTHTVGFVKKDFLDSPAGIEYTKNLDAFIKEIKNEYDWDIPKFLLMEEKAKIIEIAQKVKHVKSETGWDVPDKYINNKLEFLLQAGKFEMAGNEWLQETDIIELYRSIGIPYNNKVKDMVQTLFNPITYQFKYLFDMKLVINSPDFVKQLHQLNPNLFNFIKCIAWDESVKSAFLAEDF